MVRKSRKKNPAKPQARPDVVATAVAPDGSADPTLLTSQVVVGGKTLTLCWDLGSLALAEHELRAAGHDVDLSVALPGLTLESIMVLFAAAVRRFHPEIGYAAALRMLQIADVHKVKLAIADAWRRSLAEPSPEDKKNPTQPGPSAGSSAG